VIRLAGALLSDQNDEWLVQRRYLSAESMALTLAGREQTEQPQAEQEVECPRGRGHLIAWVCPTGLEGCGVHAKDASAVSRGVPS